MKTLLILSSLTCLSLAFSEEQNPPSHDEAVVVAEHPLLHNAKGLVLVGSRSKMLSPEQLESIEGFHTFDLCIPGREGYLEAELTPLYKGRDLTACSIREIQNQIQCYYQNLHRPFVIVEVPEQDVTSGVLQIVVVESLIGKIDVQNNCWSSSDRLTNYLRITPGGYIDQQQLADGLHFMNRNPFRRANIIYAPGDEFGTTDITLQVSERRPYRFYAGVENTGVPTTQRQRWFAGANFGNFFDLDHILSYQYTAAFDIRRFQAHALQYLALLPYRQILNFFGGVSWVEADLDLPSMKSNGFSGQASGRYNIPFFPGIYLQQELSLGYDFKRTNNTIEFTDDLSTFGENVNLTQFAFGYSGVYERNSYRLDFSAQLFWSPGQWINDQSNERYESLRPGAKNHWVYALGSVEYLRELRHAFSFYLQLSGQLSSQNLLPSEQFGLGGYDTVRGYNEREVSTETGFLLRSELRTPAYPLPRCFRTKLYHATAIQLLGFFDYGYGRFKEVIPGEPKNNELLGIGPGLRFTAGQTLTARLDWGIKLHKSPRYGGGSSMIHFSVTGSY